MKLTILAPAALLLLSGSVFAQDTAAGDAAAGGIADPAIDSPSTTDYEDSSDVTSADDGTPPDFATADADKDGLLSISEVQAAMPDLVIEDENGDGFVNQSEVEAAVTGLAFESEGYTGGSSLVSEAEYDLIVSHLDTDDADVDIQVDGDVDVEAN